MKPGIVFENRVISIVERVTFGFLLGLALLLPADGAGATGLNGNCKEGTHGQADRLFVVGFAPDK